ncbi:MAG: molybdenum cofactor guanylyltransferase [Candidatus Bipolaricaulaceae bacterium]
MSRGRDCQETTLVILAGGAARRMGQPKHLLPTPWGTTLNVLVGSLGGLFSEILVVGASPGGPGVRAVADLYPARCPLTGLYSGLAASRTGLNLVVACDMPLIRPALARLVLAAAGGVDVAVPVIRGHHEPLCAAYRKRALPVLWAALEEGDYKITSLYSSLRVARLAERAVRRVDPGLDSFVNLNARASWRQSARG